MNMHPMGNPDGMMVDVRDSRRAALRRMTAEQLLHLGTHQVVYLRSGMRDGERAFVLFGADGTALMVVATVEIAEELAAERGLKFVAVH